jgi:DTW domain
MTSSDEKIKFVLEEEEKRFLTYLEEVATQRPLPSPSTSFPISSRRSFCCNTSRSLYCPECYRVLIPIEEWPMCIQNVDGLQLPFAMDIILGRKERRNSSSGIQMIVLCQMMKIVSATKHKNVTNNSDHHYDTQEGNPSDSFWWRNTRLYDLNRGDTIPSYPSNTTTTRPPTTFILFPTKTSVPLSSVAEKIEKLVVLDVKWTRSGLIQLDSSLSALPAVHLEYPPQQSQFWRWHNRGEGMLSTMEAIYFAAIEVSIVRGWSQRKREKIISIVWLFALQRRAIIHCQQRNHQDTGSVRDVVMPMPFSTEGKTQQRNFRIRRNINHNFDAR